MRLLDANSVEALVLGDTDTVGGYLVTGYDEGDRGWRRMTTESPYVDGEFETARALAKRFLTLTVFIEGATWDEVSARHEALLDAVEAHKWLLEPVPGFVWACDAADSVSPLPSTGIDVPWREVTLTIPARPSRGV